MPRARKRGGESGFTLIELLTVITIVILLTAMMVVVAVGMNKRARIMGTKGRMQMLLSGLEGYYQEFRYYPRGTEVGLVNLPVGSQWDAGDIYVLWKGWGRVKPPQEGKIKAPSGQLVGPFVKESDLQFAEEDEDKLIPIDLWGHPFDYRISRERGMDPYAYLRSRGPDEKEDTDDDILVKR